MGLKIPDDVLYQELNGEIILLNLTSQNYFGLDDVGATMWRLMIEHQDCSLVVDRLAQIYEASPDMLRKDLEALIDKLTSAGLLIQAPEPAGA